MSVDILTGDNRALILEIPDKHFHCVVTSPPYYRLRNYGVDGQMGLEQTPQLYVKELVALFREIRRTLRDDGTVWLNLGDSYARNGGRPGGGNRELLHMEGTQTRMTKIPLGSGLKPKDLIGIPWRVAFALQEDGWYLRQDIVWHKPNPMPESITDRCTKAHEYIFLLSKKEKYYFDAEAIKEPCSPSTHARVSQDLARQEGSHRANGGMKSNGPMRAVVAGSTRKLAKFGQGKRKEDYEASMSLLVDKRNKRSVWRVASRSYKGAHFATFPAELVRPCILAGCPVGGIVFDPFGGSGTTGMVANQEGRSAVLMELNPEYVTLAQQRVQKSSG